MIGGLWGITPVKGGNAGSLNDLCFSAGLGGESHGLFGVPDFNPTSVTEPDAVAILAAASARPLIFLRRRQLSR